jgi:hypothetical protein
VLEQPPGKKALGAFFSCIPILPELGNLQGSPQWIQLKFAAPTTLTSVRMTFQGGFCGETCVFQGLPVCVCLSPGPQLCLTELAGKSETSQEWHSLGSFYPSDINSEQVRLRKGKREKKK